MTRRILLALLLGTALSLGLTFSSDPSRDRPAPDFTALADRDSALPDLDELLARLENRRRPADHPGDAQALSEAKRRAWDGRDLSRAERYRLAHRQMDQMPRFASRLGRELPPGTALKAGALGTWESLGPGNIGGRTRALVIDPTDPQTLYAAGVSGGVWKSVDGGGSWRALTDMLPNIAVSTLVMDPNHPQTLYAGTGEGFFREELRGTALPLQGGGIFKTTDGGEEWELLERTAQGPHFLWVNKIIVSPLDSERIYAATRTGVWRSEDGGERFNRVLNPNVKGGCLDLALTAHLGTDTVFASCGTLDDPATVYRKLAAEQGGANGWEAVLSEPAMRRTTLAIAPSDPNVVYALSAQAPQISDSTPFNEGPLHAFFRSDESGAPGSFVAKVRSDDPVKLNRQLLSNIIFGNISTCFGVPDSFDQPIALGWYANTLAVDPVDPDVVWTGGIDLLRSDDGGSTWGIASYWLFNGLPSFVHADQHALIFDPGYDGDANQRVYSVNDGGVFRTDNARATPALGPQAPCNPFNSSIVWQPLNNDYGVTQFYHGTVLPGGSYVGGTQDNGTIQGSDQQGVNGWFEFGGGDGSYSAFDPVNGVLYFSSQFANLAKTDGGLGVPADNGLPNSGRTEFLFITPFVTDPSTPGRLWLGGRQVWRTDDQAENWRPASTAFANGAKVSAVAVSPSDPDLVLVGLDDGHVHRQNAASSAEADAVWPGVLPRQGLVTSIAFDPNDNDVAYATYAGFGGRHVYRTENGGASWRPIDGGRAGGLPDVPVHSVVLDPLDSERLYVGTDVGVFVSTEGGRRWAVEETGFATAVTEHLTIVEEAGGTRLYAFTHGRGAWRVEVTR